MNAHPAGYRQIYWPSVITVISAAILIGAFKMLIENPVMMVV